MKPYSREKAVSYARRWAFSRNPAYLNYDDMGGDCTNFISQCLHEGGGEMNYRPDLGWYYRTGNDKAPAWSGVPYLYRFLLSGLTPGFFAEEAPPERMEPGDVIQLSFDGTLFSHSLLVTMRDTSELYVATHTFDSLNRPLSTYDYRGIRYIHIAGLR
ncbi:amidase domain-containing protein [Oscillospiraceae bacterium OttesenSCG-928-G22]|nr:amidase domain-containing protein [Oscillospiraceae bacterium OttesenSCG-928-G22]